MQRSLASLATLALGLLANTAHADPAAAAGATTSPVHAVKVTILSTMLAEEGIGEWGFAALVEVDGKKILYDTGARPRTVLDNARELHVELGDVEDVILSHFHDDHTTGLATLRRELAARNPAALSRIHVGKGIFQERRGKKANPVIENTLLLRQRMGRSRQDVVVASVGATFDLEHGVRTGSIAQ